MGSESGQSGVAVENTAQSAEARSEESLLRLLREEPYAVHFFQAVRLLERLHPERMPVGYFVSPQHEVVRFSSRTSLSFPPSELHGFREDEGRPAHMDVNFMGLTTMNGPLPHPYAEHLLERLRARDDAPAAFFDLFNHRFISLFYRSWKKYRFYVSYELAQSRQKQDAYEDPVTASIFSLLGLGTRGLRQRSAVSDEAEIYYAGLLTRRVPTAQAMKQLLEDFFEVAVNIEEFTGSWNMLPAEDLTFLRDGANLSERLGAGTVVGDAIWDQQSTITIQLGPMPLRQYLDFLPGGLAAQQLEAWLRLLGKGEFDFAVRLVLAREQVPGVMLTAEPGGMGRLGFASWIKNKPFLQDAADAVYRL